ncbi:MAG: DMSO/selenate family reductase complex A subunit [Oscillospiraceae bacterium]
MEQIILTTGRNNCGGCCRLRVHTEDGRIVRLSADPNDPEPGRTPCLRGLHYADTFLNDRRLLTPLKRIGARGEGRFAPISWDQALDELCENWVRIRDKYGPQSRYVNYAWGESGVLSGTSLCKRLLRLDGGHLDYYNSYSTACGAYTTPYVYGTAESGSSYSTLTASKLIVLWGHNPAETIFDDLLYWLRRARENGARILVVDPRRNATCKTLNAEWLPIRPATDGALLAAMAYVMLTEALYDRAFVEKFCLGWEAWFSYLRGEADGTPKTPAWAERITGLPAETIRAFAVDCASTKPTALLAGYGGQRHENGEQFTRALCALACMTGNVGVRGGWAGGIGWCHTHPLPKMPPLENPVRAEIPVFLWTDAIRRGPELTAKDGLVGADRLDTGIKLLFNLAGNQLMNQHSDLNRTAAILRDESLCEYIVCSDLFMTASAKFADLLLPGTSMFEQDNLTMPWSQGDFIGFSPKIIEPLGECRFEYDWLAELSDRLGLKEAFTAGHTSATDWLEDIYNDLRRQEPELPAFSDFRTMGTYRYQTPIERVAFREQVEDGVPFPTPSGKIELYSPALAARNDPKIPAIPAYVPAAEGYGMSAEYPLQLVGWHTIARCHSVHGNNPSLAKMHPQRLWMHPSDAAERGITDGDAVLVCNGRGTVRTTAHVTGDIAPGVTALAQGAWYDPDENGIDRGGSINVLTGQTPTPLAHGNPQHTILVEVKKA